MIQPGQDYNYPTSSGNMPGVLGQSFNLLGIHITMAMIAVVILLIVVWNSAKRRRR